MSDLALCSIRRITKLVIAAAIHATEDASSAIADAGRDLLLGSLLGATPATVTAQNNAAHIVAGAIEAADQTGGDALIVIRSIVQGTIKGAWESGADVGPVAVKSVSAAVQVAEQIGIDSNKAIESAVDGVIGVGDQIGVEATKRIVEALRSSIRWDKKWYGDSFETTEMNDPDYVLG